MIGWPTDVEKILPMSLSPSVRIDSHLCKLNVKDGIKFRETKQRLVSSFATALPRQTGIFKAKGRVTRYA